jgi:hypothetical protein
MSFAPLLGLGSYPFYIGTSTADIAVPFTIKIDGRTYPIDVKNYKRSSLTSLRDSVVSTGQADDSLFNTDGAWWRYRYNWWSGAGQYIMDLGEERNLSRFDSSVGINVWDEGELSLLRSTSFSDGALTGSVSLLCPTNSFLYASDGASLKRTSTFSSWTTITGISGTINDISTDGVNVYVATSVALYTVSSGTAATSVVASAHSRVWFAAGRLFVSVANVLKTYDSAYTATTVDTHFQASFIYTTVFAVGSKIYAGGYAGSRSEIFGFSIGSTGALVKGAEVVSLSINELIQHVTSHAGVVIFCTNKGIRMATVGADGSLTYGPLIDTPGSVTSAQAEGQYVWFNWQSIDTNKSGAGRLDLSNTPRPMQPAFATDVYADTAGLCTTVARFNGRTVLGIPTIGVYVESTTGYVTSGYIDSGQIYYGTVERKSVTELNATFQSLAANQSVTVKIYDDQVELLNSAGSSIENSTVISVQLDGEQGDWFKVRVQLGGPGTSTPQFERWRLRSFPIAPPVEQYVIPILLYGKTVVNDAQGQMLSLDTDSELLFLKEIWETKRPVSYLEGKTSRRVRLEAYEYSPDDWSDNQTGFEGTMVVRLVTL